MRRVATLAMIVDALALSAGLSPAAAEDPRYVPAAQTEATYRLTTVITIDGRETTAAEIYRVTVTASDGITAEGTITPLALVYRCPADETSKDCRAAPHFPGASREGDMITIPVPPEIGANLAKLSKITAHDFIRYAQVFPMPGPEDLDEVDKPKISDTPLYLLGSAVECDDALTKGFFPLGVAAEFSVLCNHQRARAKPRAGDQGRQVQRGPHHGVVLRRTRPHRGSRRRLRRGRGQIQEYASFGPRRLCRGRMGGRRESGYLGAKFRIGPFAEFAEH